MEQDISTLLELIQEANIQYAFTNDIQSLLASFSHGLDLQHARNKLELIINKPTRNMERLIHFSLKRTPESLALLKHIIKLGADVNIPNTFHSSLGIAIKSLNVTAVDCLLKAGADIHKTADFLSPYPNHKISPLSLVEQIVAANKNPSIELVWIRYFLQKFAKELGGDHLLSLKNWQVSQSGKTLLHIACEIVDEFAVFDLLNLDLGFVNKQDHSGYTPLASLVDNGFKQYETTFISLLHLSEHLSEEKINDLMTKLQESELVDVSYSSQRGLIRNPNTLAIEFTKYPGYRLTIKFDKQISEIGKDQFAQELGVEPAVIDALEVTKAEHILNMLLRKGADQFIKNTDARTVIDMAWYIGCCEAIYPLFKAAREQLSDEKYQLLCEDLPESHYLYVWRDMINENDTEVKGESQLHKFVENFEHEKICQCDKPGNLFCQETEMWDWLLDKHNFLYVYGHINEQDSFGETPIFSAVRLGNHRAVKALMDHGAKVGSTNHEGNTPKEYSSSGMLSLLNGGDYFEEEEYPEMFDDRQEYSGCQFG